MSRTLAAGDETRPVIQGAHSATGTGERRCRLAHRADTGHWSATDLVTLAGTGALECHRSGDTANALGTGVPCYTRHLPPHTDQMLPSHPGLLHNYSRSALKPFSDQDPPKVKLDLVHRMLFQAITSSLVSILTSSGCRTGERRSRSARRTDTGHWNASLWLALAMHWALECQPWAGTGQVLGTQCHWDVGHWPLQVEFQ